MNFVTNFSYDIKEMESKEESKDELNTHKYFTWDGSDLGKFSCKCVTKKIPEGNLTYWDLKLPNYNKVKVIARKAKDSLQCVIDELKPIFGLAKLGTHRIEIDNKLYIIIRSHNAKFRFVSSVEIKNRTNPDPIFNLHIQDIFIFRELLAINSPLNCSFCVRPVKKVISDMKPDTIFIFTRKQPVGFLEISTSLTKEISVLPEIITDKRFFDRKITLENAARRLVRINGVTISKIISSIREKLDNCIKRVDNEYIWMVSFIIDRLLMYLK